jgi:hypothetical protein
MVTDDFTMPVDTVIFTANHTSDDTLLKFSLTLPTRTHAHNLLNTQLSKGYKDLKQYVLHVDLALGLQGGC